MKNDKRTSDEAADISPAQKSRWHKLSRTLDLIGRVALCLAIVVAAIFCIRIVQDIRSADHRRVEAQTGDNSDGTLEDVLNGDWQFAGMPWSVRITEMSSTEAEAALEAAAPTVSPLPAEANGETQEEFDIIASALEMLHAQASEQEQHLVYRVDSPAMQALAYAPSAYPKQVQLIRVVQPIQDDRVNYIQLERKPAEFRQPENHSLLLPAAPENRRLAVRHDAQGVLCAELIELNAPFSELREVWEQAGWQFDRHRVQPTLMLDKTSDPPPSDMQNYLRNGEDHTNDGVLMCSQSGTTIAVIRPTSPEASSQTLLLMRLPD